MIATSLQNRRPLQIALYSGIALIVVSMLFLGQGQESTSFLSQAISVLIVPLIFYVIGILIYRYLSAPLAAPAFIATGAWLVGVGLIHLYVKRTLLPEGFQPYYWLVAALFAGVLITVTGHRARSWLIIPLMPIVQVNAVVAVMSVIGIPVAFMPALTFLLVLVWCEAPLKNDQWKSVYAGSAVVLSILLLVFTIWLPLTTRQSMMITWGAGAGVVAFLSLRHGLLKFAPLSMSMLTCASVWGLPPAWWSITWLGLASITIIFTEQLRARYEKGKEKSKEVGAGTLSLALAIGLSAAAPLFSEIAPLFGIEIHPFITIVTLAGSGVLLAWLGWRRGLLLAVHVGLWLLAASWINLYFAIAPSSGLYGMWLSLFAVFALFADRLLTSSRKEKRKSSHTMLETVTNWPVADIVIGLTTMSLLWTASNINAAAPWLLALTFSVIIAIWIATGLIYRLAALLHVALWVAPIPYALLLIIAAPALWTLPLLGLAWQLLGALFLIIAHISPRYRPSILAPFFTVGYVLLGFGFTVATGNPALLPVSLTLLVMACIATSITVIADFHPIWSLFIDWLIDPERHPYAHKHINHAFLFLSAWLSVVWLHLMLGYTGMTMPEQGLSLVIFACLWFLLGGVLARFRDAVGWPLISAGWLMWAIGLLEVFFAPTEAMLTIVIGLAVSGWSLRRTKAPYWVPVFIVQLLFAAVQIASRLHVQLQMSSNSFVLLVMVIISAIGMIYDRKANRAGIYAAVTGAIFAMILWCTHIEILSTIMLVALAVLAAAIYREWRWLAAAYAGSGILPLQLHLQLNSPEWFVIGTLHWIIGAELVKRLRPRRYRTVKTMLIDELDWATPFLIVGTLCNLFAFGAAQTVGEVMLYSLLMAAVVTLYTVRLRVFYLPYIALAGAGFSLLLTDYPLLDQHSQMVSSLPIISLLLALTALMMFWLLKAFLTENSILKHARWLVLWLKPFMLASYGLAGSSAALLLLSTFYPSNITFNIMTGLLLMAYSLSVYMRKRRAAWLLNAFLAAFYSWVMVLSVLQLSNVSWMTLPLGLALLLAHKISKERDQATFESAGIAVWLVGGILSIDRAHLLSMASLGVVIPPVLLVGYGLALGRRIPFIIGSALVLVGSAFVIAKVSIWLVPFIGGTLLLSVALLSEVRHDALEHLLALCLDRWQRWK